MKDLHLTEFANEDLRFVLTRHEILLRLQFKNSSDKYKLLSCSVSYFLCEQATDDSTCSERSSTFQNQELLIKCAHV